MLEITKERKYAKRMGRVILSCKECGKQFSVKYCIKESASFCSKECRYIGVGKLNSASAKLKRIKKNCVICGKYIFIKPSHVHIEGTYCSKKCMVEGYKTRMIGSSNPNYREGAYLDIEKRNARKKIWRKNHPEIISRINRNTRARRKKVPGKLSNGIAKKLLKLQKNKCVSCLTVLDKYHLDHIMPMALGGHNIDENIQLLCPSCNMKKSDKHPIDFMQSKGFLL